MDMLDILNLVRAGYTKDEIEQMAAQKAPNTDPEPVPVAEPSQDAQPVPTPAVTPVASAVPEPQPVPAPVPAQTQQEQPSISDVMRSIAQLTSAIQANAIATSSIPGGVPNRPTAEDMIAEIIRPSFKEVK